MISAVLAVSVGRILVKAELFVEQPYRGSEAASTAWLSLLRYYCEPFQNQFLVSHPSITHNLQ